MSFLIITHHSSVLRTQRSRDSAVSRTNMDFQWIAVCDSPVSRTPQSCDSAVLRTLWSRDSAVSYTPQSFHGF